MSEYILIFFFILSLSLDIEWFVFTFHEKLYSYSTLLYYGYNNCENFNVSLFSKRDWRIGMQIHLSLT